MARGWVAIFAHIVYGGVLGWVYASIARNAAVVNFKFIASKVLTTQEAVDALR